MTSLPDQDLAGDMLLYSSATIHEIFEEYVNHCPKNIAVIWMNQSFSYKHLNSKANQLAHFMRSSFLPLESSIVVALPPDNNLIMSLVAILKLGCAYVPLDLRSSPDQIDFILKDSHAKIILTTEKFFKVHSIVFNKFSGKSIFLDKEMEEISKESTQNLNINISNTNLAYLCYTSGSTGKPKGVQVEHRGVVRLVKGTNYINFAVEDKVAQACNITFDVSALEIWGALINGASLVCLSQETLLHPKSLANFLMEKSISILWLTARLFDQMALADPAMFANLKYLLVGGERLNPHTIFLVNNCKLGRPKYILNGYGPTENTGLTTTYPIPEDFVSLSSIPIGKPIKNTTVYVLDENLKQVAMGQHGELYTGGLGVARGYLNRPDLTKERFIQNPFSTNPNDRLYKTGDIVYWSWDGNLEYVDRIDTQVKVRGFRIELGAIENQLLQHQQIEQCVILTFPYSEHDKYICAFLVPYRDIKGIDITSVKKALRSVYPVYMIPDIFITIDKIPLTANGKADRQVLKKYLDEKLTQPSSTDTPKSKTELQLATIWSNLLRRENIGIDDKFFEIGGNSLLLMRLQINIEGLFEQELSVTELIKATTIRTQSILLQQRMGNTDLDSIVALQSKGNKIPLFLLPPISGECFCFLPLVMHLDPQQPVYALRDPSDKEGKLIFKTIDEMATFFFKKIRKFQRHGPYRIAGYSFGANLAVIISKKIVAEGETVDFLGLIDGWAKFSAFYIEEQSFRERMQKLLPGSTEGSISVDLAWQRIQLLQGYQVSPLPTKVILFKAEDDHSFYPLQDSFNHWFSLAEKGIERYFVPGDHDSILLEPHVNKLADLFKLALNKINVQHVIALP